MKNSYLATAMTIADSLGAPGVFNRFADPKYSPSTLRSLFMNTAAIKIVADMPADVFASDSDDGILDRCHDLLDRYSLHGDTVEGPAPGDAEEMAERVVAQRQTERDLKIRAAA